MPRGGFRPTNPGGRPKGRKNDTTLSKEQARDEARKADTRSPLYHKVVAEAVAEAARTARLEAAEEADHDLCNLLTSADSFLSVLWHRYVPRERKDIELSRDVEMVIAELRRRSDMLRQHTKEHP